MAKFELSEIKPLVHHLSANAPIANEAGVTPCCKAFCKRDFKTVKLLLKRGTDPKVLPEGEKSRFSFKSLQQKILY